ncbi:hypothetical protein P639_1874 [Acinetobacter baumannii UH0207]|nr:hypothetical protein P639_1874 [Acinetobacter baumannii UH0207]
MVGCASSPQHTTTGKTSPSGKRIFIPQERVIIERPIPPKVEPASYRAWLNTGDHYERVREYENSWRVMMWQGSYQVLNY